LSDICFDTGALIAFERNDRAVVAIVTRAYERGDRIFVPAGALAQAWRDGRRQSRLARLLGGPVVSIVPLDNRAAREVGQLLGVTGQRDVVDGSVVWCARQHGVSVLTSDPDDLRAFGLGITITSC
jgi:hypothetical protein